LVQKTIQNNNIRQSFVLAVVGAELNTLKIIAIAQAVPQVVIGVFTNN